jgi:hypothetical protein
VYHLELQLQRTIRMLEIFRSKLQHRTTVGLLDQGKLSRLTQKDFRFLLRNRGGWDAIIQGLVDSRWALLSLRAMLKLLQPKPKRLAGPARAQLSHTAKPVAKKRKRIATAMSAR